MMNNNGKPRITLRYITIFLTWPK